MKRTLLPALLLLLVLALCACAGRKSSAAPSPSEDQTLAPEAEELLGVWVNAGQYAEGRDFVETLSLSSDGTAVIHLDYQGRDYATLKGTFETQAGVLIIHLSENGQAYDRVYDYTLENGDLILTSEQKTVRYHPSGD